MLDSWTIIAVALAYLGALFAVASYGDRIARRRRAGTPRPFIYALSLGVYCTSWTFFGSVGLSAQSGLDFLPIYIGPIIMLVCGWPLLIKIVEIAKKQNITSIADFIAARYGKNQALGAVVAAIAVIGTLPYIALQLKAVASSLTTLLEVSGTSGPAFPVFSDLALVVAAAMAVFTVLFGTRHIDATEHQDGVIAAIAVESVVKLVAFTVVGAFVTFSMFGGIGPMLDKVAATPEIEELFTRGLQGDRWLTMTLLALVAIVLLPRQFHVAVVENTHISDVKRAAWLFPLYLIAINLFVVPIAIAGLLTFEPGTVDADSFVLALPVAADSPAMTLVAFVGGLSAATAMVIVATLALSIMVCNDIVVPLLLRQRQESAHEREDMLGLLLNVRRVAIFAILGLGYAFYHMIGDSVALAQIGLLSFAAIAQFAPAFFGGLIWRRATARGAMAGTLTGFALWAYTLILPAFTDAGWFPASLLEHGPFGIGLLRPEMLFNLEFEPLTHGVLWSLIANIAVYVAVSLLSQPQPIERLQANLFVAADLPAAAPSFRLWRTSISTGDLKRTVARYLGAERTERSFAEFAAARHIALDDEAEADIRLLRFAEHLLASAVGAASSRLVLALLLERYSANRRGAMRLLDDASAAIQYNRDLLQSAIDHVGQGIAVFDKTLNLICWNRQFRGLLHLPPDIGRVGVPLNEVVRTIVGNAGIAESERAIAERLDKLIVSMEPYQERLSHDGSVVEVRSSPMPDGGFVVTFADITERVEAAEALQRANETLERRVEERTARLTELNAELVRAKAEAEAANLGKTRFIAAASHDILQPLNAARLYTSSLVERHGEGSEDTAEDRRLAANVDASLEAVEDILTALLDISRLDAGALKPDVTSVHIGELFGALEREFGPVAAAQGLELRIVPSSLSVRTDRRLLRRVLQNLVSNALKYTPRGRVLVGCRRTGDTVRIAVLDTGTGIAEAKQTLIFQEFQRLDAAPEAGPGLGLGLSIVERIVHMLGHGLELTSVPGRGSAFSVAVPLAEPATEPAFAIGPRIGGPATARMEGLGVLCIDNEGQILDGMETLLEGWGCAVFKATGSAEALAVLDRHGSRIGCILADYHLHREDGLSLVETLRARAGRHLPAVLITADRSRTLRDRAAALGVLYLKKPVRPASLRASIAQSLIRAEAAE